MSISKRLQTLTTQQIIDNLPVVVFEFTVNPGGSRDFTYLSASCEKILGVPGELLLNGSYPMKDFIHREDWDQFEVLIGKAIEEVVSFKWEGRVFNVHAEVKWIEAICEPVKLPDGRIAWSGIINNIRERKELERKNREADIRNLKTETLFSELFNSSPMAIVLLDGAGNVERVNHGFELLFGYTITELRGKSLNQFIVPQELEAEGNDLNSLISSEQIVRIETIRLRRDDEQIPVLFMGCRFIWKIRLLEFLACMLTFPIRKKLKRNSK
jgi:PAS domain S-box-containing protein